MLNTRFLSYFQYDVATGVVTKAIQDVDTEQDTDFADLPDGWETPAAGGLHLITEREVDAFGRPTKETDPNGNVSYTVFLDAAHEVRTYAGWDNAANRPTGPTVVVREDRAGSYVETLTMSVTPDVADGRPTGEESIGNIQSLARSYTSSGGQVIYTDAYFNLDSLNYSTAVSLGTEGTNFYRTRLDYNNRGWLKRQETPTGTITRTIYDSRGQVTEIWVGTDDTPTSGFWSPTNNTGADMVKVASFVYDNGGVGDGNLTQQTVYPGDGADNRVTQYFYDWRNRLVATKGGVQGSEETSVQRPILYTEYDNLNQGVAQEYYDGDNVSIVDVNSDGVPDKPTFSLRRTRSTVEYDEQGRAFRTHVFSVDQSAGTVSTDSLTTELWFNHRGNVIKNSAPGGLVSKIQYDGAGRVVKQFATDGGGDEAWTDATNVNGDAVLEQTDIEYDANGNAILVAFRQRFHDETDTGALGDPETGPLARVYYTASYYDALNRLTAVVNVGTNGGEAYERPSTPDSRSDTVLVTSYDYRFDELQQVSLSGSPGGGTFTLAFAGQTTGGIAYNASAVAVQTALEALSNIDSGDVVVTGGSGGPWTVQFSGDLGGTDVSMLTANGSGLTGGSSPGISIAITTPGGDTGRLAQVTDPRGIQSRTESDPMGRTVRTIEAYVNGVPSNGDDRITQYTYDGSNNLLTVKAVLPSDAIQETKYVYAARTSTGSGVNSNAVLTEVWRPDPNSGAASSSEKETFKVNALGQRTTATDRNGNVHAYTYDVLGRLRADAVTTLGTEVDGAVRRMEIAYDTAGRPYLFTSCDAASSGTVVNQVLREFNGLGQLITEYQEHAGAVNTETTPNVQYAYSEMADSANHSRLVSMTYPDGRVLEYNYDAGLDDTISRLTSLSDNSGTLQEFVYLGLGTVVRRAHPEPDIDLTYIKLEEEDDGDAGDPYIGLDRFGRVVDQRWIDTGTDEVTDRFQYGYDRNSNRLYRENLVNAVFSELYHASGSANGYDLFNQLTGFERGELNGSQDEIDGTPAQTQTWSLDAMGNWSSVSTDGTPQSRTHNAQNELTGVGGSTLTYDANGNMTTDETGRIFLYDAWNRLIEVQDDEEETLVRYEVDVLSRRISETADEVTTVRQYSAAWQVLEEQVEGDATVQYVWSPVYVDAMVLRDRDADANGSLDERLYVQQDANWNVTAVVDESGGVQERYLYTPFGQVTYLEADWDDDESSAVAWVYGHQGGRFEILAGVYNFRKRDLSPTLGRWLRVDPIGFAGGYSNLYLFIGNGPESDTDPYGLEPAGAAHMYPLFLGGDIDQVLFVLTEAEHTAMHAYLRQEGLGWHIGVETKWKTLSDAKRRAIIEEGMKRAGIPQSLINNHLDDLMKTGTPGMNLSVCRELGKPKALISRAALEEARNAARGGAQVLRKATNRSEQSLVNRGSKKLPIIGWLVGAYFYFDTAEAKGFGGAALDAFVDGLPIVGWVKFGDELACGKDWVPNQTGSIYIQKLNWPSRPPPPYDMNPRVTIAAPGYYPGMGGHGGRGGNGAGGGGFR